MGEIVGLWAWRNFRWVTAAAMLPLALALAGCEEEAGTTLQASQSEVPEIILEREQGEAEKFTTEGKPSKTIDTPWGPREIYDPLQDLDVRKAFQTIYEKKYKTTFDYYNQKRWHNAWYLNNQSKTIFEARNAQYFDALRNGCTRLATSRCGEYYETVGETLNKNEDYVNEDLCDLKSNIGNPKLTKCELERFTPLIRSSPSRCELNGEIGHPSVFYYPIGSSDFLNLPKSSQKNYQVNQSNPDMKIQMEIFFNFECLDWIQN